MIAASIELAPQQAEAVAKIHHWYADNPDQQIFRLFGFAGTGKTKIARHIVDQLGVQRVLFAAFTGKAAFVLRSNGCDAASTIHSLIYQPVEKVRAKLNTLQRQHAEETDPATRQQLEREILAEERRLESPHWILREDSIVGDCDLLVLDEVSMVGHVMAQDLLSFGCKTLCLGDPAQLPPVDGGGYFINANPDHLLTQIHRTALDSPVTRLATTVRNSQLGQRKYGVDGLDGDSGRLDRLTVDELLSFDQVLVGRNATRWQAIHLLRALRGLTGSMPQAGDQIICLANSAEADVFNGQQFSVLDAQKSATRNDRFNLTVRDDEGRERNLPTWASGFIDLDGEKRAKRDGRGTVAAATFAQAITTHKAQGSQWDRVLVVDESSVFSAAAYREHVNVLGSAAASIEAHINGQRWLYTAVTRAKQQVVMVPQIAGLLA